MDDVETLVVGAGQAGIAMSEHLSNANISHLVVERHQIAERWRSARWDSLVANGPAWHDRFPGLEFNNVQADGFASKQDVVNYFEQYAQMIKAPIRCGVEVTEARKLPGRRGFHVTTSGGDIRATNVVAATGPFQTPLIPPVVSATDAFFQLHSSDYKNPLQLPSGNVLVVGAGSSGTQIADELLRAGKQVYLSVGAHDRPPRSYRGHDFVWWLGVLGKWEAQALAEGLSHVTIAVSGAHGGETVDFRRLASRGMTLVGLTKSCNNGVIHFASDLAENIRKGDENYLSVLDEADAFIERNGLDLPEEPDARYIQADPQCMTNPLLQLNMKQAAITSIIWATGYTQDYSWLNVNALDDEGKPSHQRGVAKEPGIYFLGLPWQSRRGSSFIWGVWHDAKYLADHMVMQRGYFQHHEHTVEDRVHNRAHNRSQP